MEMRFADLSHLSIRWQAQIERWGIRVIESFGKEMNLSDQSQIGGRYIPHLQVVEFFYEWTLETLAHEVVHVMQEVYGRLTDIAFSKECYYSLLDLGYDVEDLEVEAEAYALQNQPELVLSLLERLSPCGT